MTRITTVSPLACKRLAFPATALIENQRSMAPVRNAPAMCEPMSNSDARIAWLRLLSAHRLVSSTGRKPLVARPAMLEPPWVVLPPAVVGFPHYTYMAGGRRSSGRCLRHGRGSLRNTLAQRRLHPGDGRLIQPEAQLDLPALLVPQEMAMNTDQRGNTDYEEARTPTPKRIAEPSPADGRAA